MTGNNRKLFHTSHDYESSGFIDYGQDYNNEYLIEMNNLVSFRNENVITDGYFEINHNIPLSGQVPPSIPPPPIFSGPP